MSVESSESSGKSSPYYLPKSTLTIELLAVVLFFLNVLLGSTDRVPHNEPSTSRPCILNYFLYGSNAIDTME